ncbi:MAG: 2-amino-4-hydroxy-6-hydroxymethyldihydropteridine diphosphokinase [Candidatus Omnitrophica bacterium]|nr:2-amino-4-hydroxy-6-hydroxymethyldihydropteridine diphosphokinase [Candidatus Omnitrophota bacterium]MBU4590272.1 2-amino-4-hydroxy-6-hydroxymethyldihydropteridine diphosphokinase [Candidatus Omnitrophota bacterium]
MRCYIGVGSNLGDRQGNIEAAIQGLREAGGIEVTKVSSIYETEPVGGPQQPKYLNGVIAINTELEPRQLLLALQKIENQFGRERSVKNGPRTIDLDILMYGEEEIDEPDLKIPHPRMHEREFVLKPLRDIVQG